MKKELYKKYRPKKLSGIIGQKTAVRILQPLIDAGEIPHTILLTGPSGCGKTTIGRILRRVLGCSKYDFEEVNCRKIEEVRSIKSRMHSAPMNGPCRIWLIDECHMLTSDAQNEFLKTLEDTPEHVYFFLATTEPNKLKKTIRTRCTDISLQPINDSDLEKLLKYVIKQESAKIHKDVIQKIVKSSEGSARKALVYLNSVIKMSDRKEMLEAIIPSQTEAQSIKIARALLNKINWRAVCSILRDCKDEDPEQLRWMVLGYTKAVMLSGKNPGRCYIIIDAFRDHFYDSKWAGFIAACFEVIVGG